MRFHLIGNSHLDPVWLWDWREGLNEGIITCRTILHLMDEFPELTYIRGETSIYRHIQEHDRPTFDRIREQIDAGRWDVVGGTLCQPDTNLPATEVLNRHFTCGLNYMQRELGVRPRVAWAADSFGHSFGWPEIYSAAGMDYFAFSRPFEADCPLPSPAFWWEGAGGRRVLCWRIPVGWYGTDRSEVARRLDQYREKAPAWGLENVAITFGLGNHGGGPSKQEIREILAWRDANPDVEIEFSTFHRFFDALSKEKKSHPVVRKELNFTLRGCYASAFRYKKAYRRTENLLLTAERTSSVISAALDRPAPDLNAAWDSMLFNTFHDILPGSSIESTYEDQHAWLGVAYHDARRHELAALTALAAECDTRVPSPAENMPSAVPVVLFNPHPVTLTTLAEFEACMDYRLIQLYKDKPDALPVEVIDHRGQPVPFQLLAVDNQFAPHLPWRKRFLFPATLPACGYQVVRVAWNETPRLAPPIKTRVRTRGDTFVANEALTVSAKAGAAGVDITLDGKKLFGRDGLRLATFDDPFGSWGNHDGDHHGDDISNVLASWQVTQTKVLEKGPLRAVLWVMLTSGTSRLELSFSVDQGARHVAISARLLWNERSARLKLLMPGAGERATFEVPGGEVTRGPLGEVPGGRWIRADAGPRPFVFASDALYNFDLTAGTLRATVVRSTRYARNGAAAAGEEPWRPHQDLGEHCFKFAIGAGDVDAGALADSLEQPIALIRTASHAGPRGRSGSFASLSSGARLLAVKPAAAGKGWVVRIQGGATKAAPCALTWLGQRITLGRITRHEILSFHLTSTERGWIAARVTTAEEPRR
ncbi:MAG: glycoside hydrolase family 38 [Rariglobus sp.]|jgi:alpha-mannosidase|nr:glycoside hydrolase family 38 [Rariglobus sp.]